MDDINTSSRRNALLVVTLLERRSDGTYTQRESMSKWGPTKISKKVAQVEAELGYMGGEGVGVNAILKWFYDNTSLTRGEGAAQWHQLAKDLSGSASNSSRVEEIESKLGSRLSVVLDKISV